jgi:hypothetical protein
VIFTAVRHQLIFPASVRLPAAIFNLLPPFPSLFDLPRPSVTFAFAQFVSFRPVRDLPSLFSTVFDDEEQIGPISGNVVFPKQLWTICLLRRLVGVGSTEASRTNRRILQVFPVPAQYLIKRGYKLAN